VLLEGEETLVGLSLFEDGDTVCEDSVAGIEGRGERPVLEISAAIYFFVSLPSSTVVQVAPSGDISNLNL
jgi:hypothetical protein